MIRSKERRPSTLRRNRPPGWLCFEIRTCRNL